VLLTAVDSYQDRSGDLVIHDVCHVDRSLTIFKNTLRPFYEERGEHFDGELLDISNLHFELPGHNHLVPWKHPMNETGDLTPERFDIFARTVNL